MKKVLLILVVYSLVTLLSIQSVSAVAPLSKGINIGNWLNSDDYYMVQINRYLQSDWENINSLGCDHIRLFVNFNTSDCVEPDYKLSPIYYRALNQAVAWAEELGMTLVITNTEMEIADVTVESAKERMVATWKDVASRYANKGENTVAFEIFANPTDIMSTENWNSLAEAIVNGIREVNDKHTIIVGARNYSIDELSDLAVLGDDNVVYAFEFFKPYLFTHQGATFDEVSYNTTVVPFPQDAGPMPDMAGEDAGTAAEDAYNNYENTGTVDYINSELDKAVQFASDKGVPVWCASFGTIAGSFWGGYYVKAEYRAPYLEAVRTKLEDNNIGWALAGYNGGFGIMYNNSLAPNHWETWGVFEFDVNDSLTNALSLTAPETEPYYGEILGEAFAIFDDKPTPLADVSWWLGEFGEPNFFVKELVPPKVGEFAMGMLYPGQYNAIDFYFRPYLDLLTLVEDEYVIDAFIQCWDPEGHVQFRFEDTNMDFEERPWRMNYHIDDNVIPFDGEWQYFSIPLNQMVDQGAWDPDDETWYGGPGELFDWTMVQRFQLVSETGEQFDTEIYLDRIRVVHPTDVTEREPAQPGAFKLSANYPNPFNPSTTIEFELPETAEVELAIFNVRGERIKTLYSGQKPAGCYKMTWNGTNSNGSQVSSGVYFYRLKTADQQQTNRMVLMR